MSADWKLSGISVYSDGAERKQLLKDIHMTFEAGKITLLIGRNGAGKSTLLETMAGIRPIQEGSIELGSDPLWLMDSRRRRLNREVAFKLGIAMQSSESQWFASTVRNELLYSLKPYSVNAAIAEQRIERALAGTGLPQELMERDPWALSGGQQRRLSLACLLACEPEWLLLDEPTAGLDADGIRRLCAVLEAHRAAGRGAVVATHDLDALLPLADAVAVVSGGTVRAAAPAAAVAHAAAAPQALRVLAKLHAKAALPPQTPALSDGAPWPAPREVAAALAAELMRPAAGLTAVGAAGNNSKASAVLAVTRSMPIKAEQSLAGRLHIDDDCTADESSAVTALPASDGLKPLRSDRLDPRALVLVYLILAASILAQKTALELSLAAIVTMVLLMPLRALIWPWIRVIRAYLIMILIFCVMGGAGFDPLSFNWEKVWPIAIKFGKLLLIMLLGMPMLKLMTPYRLQRSIEQTLGWLDRLRVPIHSFALIVTLIFRFIPLLIGEWERFAKLAHARGKAVTPLRTVPFNMLLPVLLPYMRSILRLAEQMADALEARGFGYALRKPAYGFRLRFGWPDVCLLSIAAGSSLLLVLFASLL